MERSLADELPSQILQPKVQLGHDGMQDRSRELFWCEDVTLWQDAIEDLDGVSDLNREWQRRRNHFHTVGYRDGLMAGKEPSVQAGFNMGFDESVFVGSNWGLVRGVTSALSCLPDGLKERMVKTEEKRNKFNRLYESANSLSTTDALKLFHDDLSNKNVERRDNSGCSSCILDSCNQNLDSSHLDRHCTELLSLISESPAVKVHRKMDQ